MSDVFVGDVGTVISLDCGAITTAATLRQVIVKKPNGRRVTWNAVQDAETSIKYVVQVGDLDVAGDWQLQAYVEFPTWKGRGEVATLKVRNKI